MDSCHSSICSCELGTSAWQPPLPLRLRQHVGKDDRPKQSSSGLLSGRIHQLPSATYHRNLQPDTGMLGASAAIFTLAAIVMLMSPLKFSWLFLAPQGLVAIIYFVLNVALVYAPSVIPGYDPSVAYIAHVIGFTVGIPFGIAWSLHWKKNLVISLGLFSIYLVILALLGALAGIQTPFGVF